MSRLRFEGMTSAQTVREIAKMTPLSQTNKELLDAQADYIEELEAKVKIMNRVSTINEGHVFSDQLERIAARLTELERTRVTRSQVESIVATMARHTQF